MYTRAVLLIIAALVVMVAPAGADSEGDAFVTKSAPAAVTAGDTITYTITIGSNGPGPAVDVELKDPVPAGTTAVSAEPESQCDEVEADTDVFECDLGTVSEENPETIILVVQTSESTPSSVTNVATITSGEGSDEPNNEASVTTIVAEPSPPPPPPPPPPEPPPPTPEPPPAPPPPAPEPPPAPPPPPPPGPPPGPEADLVLTKQDAPDPVVAGGQITYSLTVTNAGPDAATGVQLVDDLPFSATLVSATSSQGFCSGTDLVSCHLGSIASSASATVTIVVKVSQPGSVFNSAAVFATFPSDPAPANNGTAATTTVVSSSSPPPPPSPPTPPVPPSPPVTPPPAPTTTLAAAPDVIPPREVAGVRATVGSRSVVVRWRTPSEPDFLRVEMTRSSRGERERVVYSGSGETFTDRSVRNGVRYVYRLRSFDRTGNASTGVQFAATPKALLLFSPPPNARLSSPPLLRWVAVRGARYYNVQLYRGKTKVLSTWPRANRLQLRARWTFRGRGQRLAPGVYHWFVWSGRGSRARPSYGPLLGRNSFVVEVRVR